MRGFTLIEVIIYTALLGLLLTTTLTTVYSLIDSTHRQNDAVADTLEASFITQKIAWLIAHHTTIETPSENSTSSVLTLTTTNHETNSLRMHNETLELSIDSDPFIPITRSQSVVHNFIVTHTPKDQTHLRTIEITFTLNHTPYGPFRYESFY